MSTEITPFSPESLPSHPHEQAGSVDLLGLILTGLAPQSAKAYRKDWSDFAAFTGGGLAEAGLWRLLRLDQGQANALALAYRSALEARKLSPATISRRLAALVRAVNRARMVGLTTVVLEVDSPKTEALRDTSGPGAKGWKQLLAKAIALAEAGRPGPVRDVAILLLLHDRALRRGEGEALDYPEDLDVSRPAVRILGKGRRVKEWLTISERSKEAIVRWLTIRGDWPGPLFTRCDAAAGDGRGRLTGESINRIVKAAAKRAGLERTVRAHGLRHESITAALDAGWDVREVRKFSRHAKVDTVLIYDDNRQDIGGEISKSMERPAARRRRKR